MARNPFLELFTEQERPPIPGTFWATVTSTSPLRVKRDAEPVLPVTPQTIANLAVGDRVLCLRDNRQIIVLGRMGGVEQPVVASLTMQNGWTGYGGGYRYPEFEVLPDGRVQLHGMIKPGTRTNGTVIATFPSALAPSRRQVYIVGAGVAGAGRVDVTPDGELVHAVFSASADADKVSWMTLETVSW